MGIKKTRILIICKGHKNIAGAQLYLKQVCSLFSPDKYELHFCLHKADGLRVFQEIGENKKVFIWEYDWRHLPAPTSIKQGMELFKKIGPDLVLFNSSEDKVLSPILASYFARVPRSIMAVHWAQAIGSLPLFRKRFSFPVPLPSRYSIKTRVLRGVCLRSLSKIIFVNNMTRDAYVQLYKIPKSRCITIYNGIDTGSFVSAARRRRELRESFGVNNDEFLVLATGNLTQVKGYDHLIRAVWELLQNGLPIRCFIAGQGEEQRNLQEQIKSLSLGYKVTLLGYRDDIPSFLAASDIFCMPSLNEALGYSLLEALATGLPVVASNVGGIPEVITHGKEGLLVSPEDPHELACAIEKLWKDKKLRKNMKHQCMQTVREKFSLQGMLAKTASVFEVDLNGPEPRDTI